jgi:hypothetical protein
MVQSEAGVMTSIVDGDENDERHNRRYEHYWNGKLCMQ